ncbi:GDSL esterase/lipase 1-like [Coffea eugenioides]|uniref:GDSL esterase/lipase 1-like n=1 Tax=Coffea eugenioides TaxID=49369 RepID=UPI000F60FCED|nr:GDSL esterase/lipase 1-like [Coffea eugenioides]
MKMSKEYRIGLNLANSCIQLCLIAVFVVLASLTIPSDCFHHDDQYPKTIAGLFVFGDSLIDPGNNNYINTSRDAQANFPPYGVSFFKYPSGRFCDGRVIPDFIAEYAKLPFIPPYLQIGYRYQLAYGANFASGGAGALVEPFSGLVIDLKKQLWYFNQAEKQLRSNLGKGGAERIVSNSVYLFSIGANDYSSDKPKDYVAMVVGNITAALEVIYKKGGRKFGVVNMPPIGCLPLFRAADLAAGGTGECNGQITALAKLHNVLLSQKLKHLQKQLKGFRYSYFDIFTTAVEMFDNPSKYGFKEVKSACCGSGPFRGARSCGGRGGFKEYELCDNPQDYFFFDSNHPTQAANQQLAELMWAGPSNITWPHNLKSLFQISL